MDMNREEVLAIMIDTVNEYNYNLMVQAKMNNADITKNIDGQYPALHHMMGLIYDDLAKHDVFK
jgi:hypothetical protein